MRIATGVVSIVVALLAVAHDDDDDGSSPPSTSATVHEVSTTDGATSAPEATETVTPARRALDDVLSWLEDPSTVDTDRFTAEFLDSVPVDEIIAVFEDL